MEKTLLLLLIGLIAGVFSGVLGIGGGIVIIPMLVYFLGFSQHQAQGTSLGLLLPPVGALAVLNYYKAGFVDIRAALLMVITFLIGSYLSSLFAIHLSESIIKKIFAIFLLAYSMKLFFGK
ncbi:MAG: sulfite exporter TauE/SafE family protein [Ignavibacteriaceae bacterium]|jgi:hypothetical protein